MSQEPIVEAWLIGGLPTMAATAAVRAAWPAAAGPMFAGVCEPLVATGGVVTVAIHSVFWDAELRLLAPHIVDRLRAAGVGVCWLRFVDGGTAWVDPDDGDDHDGWVGA